MLCLLDLLFISLDPSALICPDLSSRSPNRFASIDTRRVMQNAAQRRKEADEARLKKKEELMEQQRERGGAKAKDCLLYTSPSPRD